MKILAVDDEPYILELMPLLAARAGFPDVTTFSSATRALDVLTTGDVIFDCLLLDINMPEMNGIELCACVRQLETYRKTPIIMLTAMSEQYYMDTAFKAGATDYATKPFDINELGARLRVAHELIIALRELEATKKANAACRSAVSNQHGFALSEAIHVEGAPELVTIDAFRNYLKQSSRAGLAASQMLAIKIDQIEQIYASTTPAEFAYALGEVSDAVRTVLRTNSYLMSYAGNGIFVVVSNCAILLPSAEIEAEVQHLLDEKNSEYDSGSPMDITVSLGNPLQPSTSKASDIAKSIDRIIARAESRAITKRDGPPVANIRGCGA